VVVYFLIKEDRQVCAVDVGPEGISEVCSVVSELEVRLV